MCSGHLIIQVNLKFCFEKSILCFVGNSSYDLNKMRSSKASKETLFAVLINNRKKLLDWAHFQDFWRINNFHGNFGKILDNSLLAESSKAEKRNHKLDFCVKSKKIISWNYGNLLFKIV
jgi:hypothetical protein